MAWGLNVSDGTRHVGDEPRENENLDQRGGGYPEELVVIVVVTVA